MPAATVPPAAKKQRDDQLWLSLKEHILLERQKKREEQEAEVEEERLRKERQERDRQDAMTLGETRDQIQLLNTRLDELRNEKQQLFLRLKKVLNEDENRKKQQQQKDSEMFALQNMVQTQGPHGQIFLPPRAPHQQLMQKYLQSVPPMGNMPTPPNKRGRSPSPTLGYYKTNNPQYSQTIKIEDGRRGGEVARTVLWNKPTYQNSPGTLYYPANAQESRGQAIIYPTYAPNMSLSLHQGYHVELQQVPPPPPQSQPPSGPPHKIDSKSVPQGAQVYHINLDQSSGPPQQSSSQPGAKLSQSQSQVQHKSGAPPPAQITMEKLNDRGYHLDKQQPVQGHLSDNIYRMPPGMHANIMGIPPQPQQSTQQMQPVKPGGSISQGYAAGRVNPSSGPQHSFR